MYLFYAGITRTFLQYIPTDAAQLTDDNMERVFVGVSEGVGV